MIRKTTKSRLGKTRRREDKPKVHPVVRREGSGEVRPELPSLPDLSKTIRSDTKAMCQTLEEHSVRRVPVSEETVKKVEQVIDSLLRIPNPRYKAAGAKLAMSALRYNLAVVEVADKMVRLDTGSPTEINQHQIKVPIEDPDVLRAAILIERRTRLAPGGAGAQVDEGQVPNTSPYRLPE